MSSPILDFLKKVYIALIVAAFLSLCMAMWPIGALAAYLSLVVAMWRINTRGPLKALHLWAESNHLQLIDIRLRWPSALMNTWSQRLFDIDVVDSTGRKRRGHAVCGPQFWWQSSKTVYVEWEPGRNLD